MCIESKEKRRMKDVWQVVEKIQKDSKFG